MLGVSSVYYSKRIDDGARLLDELAALEFDGIELEYRVRPETLRQMGKRPGRDVTVLSVHAFFPNPVAAGGEGSGANAYPLLLPRPPRNATPRCASASPRSRRRSAWAPGRSCCTWAASRSSRS